MKIEFWGVRGTSPAPDADKTRYGGNTNCVVVTSQDAPGHYFILDAGTGLARFGATLSYAHAHNSTVLLSHLHLQHIIGFQFTPFAFGKAYKTHVIGPSPRDMLLEKVFDTIMEPNYSPVYGIANLLAQVKFDEVDSQLRQVGNVSFIGLPFEHSQNTLSWGYRLEDKSGSMVYLVDTVLYDPDGSLAQAGIRLSYNVDVLIVGADVPYHLPDGTNNTYATGIALARASHAKHLYLYHHDPLMSDDELDAMQARLREENPDIQLTMAAERMVIDLEKSAATSDRRATSELPRLEI